MSQFIDGLPINPVPLQALSLDFDLSEDQVEGTYTLTFAGGGTMALDDDDYVVALGGADPYTVTFDATGAQIAETGELSVVPESGSNSFSLSMTNSSLDLDALQLGILQLTIPQHVPDVASSLHLSPGGPSGGDFLNLTSVVLSSGPAAVPEPATLLLAAAGAASLALARAGRRGRRR